ncbi:MAG: hypothetical protein U0797_10715 [Gemmataceae bacterium]
MVVADPEGHLLTVCANGYGKRTPFGANAAGEGSEEEIAEEPTAEEPAEGEPARSSSASYRKSGAAARGS